MMKSKGKNKKYIFWTAVIGLFGIAGLLLVPAAMYIIKLSDRYPKVFRWISFTVFAFICIYGFLFERKWDTGFVIILCIGAFIAVSSVLNTNGR